MAFDVHNEKLPSGFRFRMIPVPGGLFDMGGSDPEAYDWEKPVHPVQLDDYYIGEYLVTQALWKAVLGAENNPSGFPDDRLPVETVSWDDITKTFLPALNDLTELTRPPGTHYRLPTEAELEYAARGGPRQSPYLYAGSNKLKEVGWYGFNSYGKTHPVGLKAPNALGLYDMSGNVYEWCWDRFDKNYYAACQKQGTVLNPTGPAGGVSRVIRGGDYFGGARHCRVSYRLNGAPGIRTGLIGFRLALSSQSVG